MTTTKKLQELKEKGWRDERVAAWIEDQCRKLSGSPGIFGPSSQTIYRWRRGKTAPSNGFYSTLIDKLHELECKDATDHQSNEHNQE